MESTYKFNLKSKGTKDTGFLVPLEFNDNMPFKFKRIFYTYNIPFNCVRGCHAYYNTKQVLICLSGSIKVKCFNGENESIYKLTNPNEALYISPKVWRSTFEPSENTVLIALSSLEYNEDDYIRDYNEFLEVIGCI
ncbi:MAG: FdtA/QdtA family cupin domain-containing protein [Paeniclostridium sordellii]|nr:FdtA/QdtA family cupin domain-containing protein [Paeniclostridium sordellii]